MAKILIVYHSRTGNTKEMAEYVKRGAEKDGALVILKDVKDAEPEDMMKADGVIIGSPTYYGLPAAEIKKFIDKSVKFHGQLDGKAAGAFSSSNKKGGGNETVIMALLQALLVHGMVIEGASGGDHYGPVSIGAPDEDVRLQCTRLGSRVANLADKLFG